MKPIYKNLVKIYNNKYFPILAYFWIGIFAFLSFIPYKFTHFVWITPFALFWLEQKYRNKPKKLILHGLLAGLFLNFFSYIWMNQLLVVFGGFPLPIAFFLFLFYSFVTGWKFPVFLLIFSYLRRKMKRYLLASVVFAILVAELLTFQLFPWYFGNLLSGNKYLAQNVEYTGVYGLSALVFLLSYPLYRTVRLFLMRKVSVKKRQGKFLFLLWRIPTIVVLLFTLNGIFLYYKWSNHKPEGEKEILMIQPNAPLEFRDGRSFKDTMEELMQRIEDFVIKSANEKKPDIIVLPESGVPFFSTNNSLATTLFNRSYYHRFEALVFLMAIRNKANVYLNEIDAMFVNDKPDKRNQRFFNNSVVFDPNGMRKESYRKSYLLAFGEYFPGGELFPFVYDLVPQVARFLPGTETNLLSYYKNKTETTFHKSHLRYIDSSVMNMDTIRDYYKEFQTNVEKEGEFLPLICYEVIIPEFVRKFSNSGNPDFIINITNDKWYANNKWYSNETFQHLELARLRSIEYRRWMVRSTNSGTSAFVDHLGNILNNQYTEVESPAYYSAKVSIIRSNPTFYLRFGNILVWLYVLGFAGLLGFSLIPSKPKNMPNLRLD